MNRREFGKRVVSGSAVVLGTSAVGAAERGPEQSPHVEALVLVFRKAQARIRAVDKEKWWFDTKERDWRVQRPFGPGTMDSTHLFTVHYRIGDREVAAWNVDTRQGTIDEITAEQPKPPRR